MRCVLMVIGLFVLFFNPLIDYCVVSSEPRLAPRMLFRYDDSTAHVGVRRSWLSQQIVQI